MKKHSSLKMKLLIIFGLLIGLTVLIEEALAVRMARKAVNENIEDHLIDKAVDTAEIIDGQYHCNVPIFRRNSPYGSYSRRNGTIF